VSELDTEELVEALAGFALFGDLSRPELEGIAHTFDEEWFGESQRIMRQGFSGVVALTPLRCLVLPRSELREWLLSLPLVSMRMLQAELRRLRNANKWRS
jgi:CRP-like cAMP-binding protein